MAIQTARIVLLIAFLLVASAYLFSEDFCTNDLKGAWSGGRCFFVPNPDAPVGVDYSGAWMACQQTAYNATLAQIHTSIEYARIQDMLDKNFYGKPAWIALMNSGANPNLSCAFPPESSYWSDAVGVPNLKLAVENTWVRRYNCQDLSMEQDHDQYGLIVPYSYKVPANGSSYPFKIYDNPANAPWYALCAISNCGGRTYTHNQGNCLDETPAETITTTYGLQECTDMCAQRMWCRSFEFEETLSTCSLFPWSLIDTNCTKTGCASYKAQECFHYDSEL